MQVFKFKKVLAFFLSFFYTGFVFANIAFAEDLKGFIDRITSLLSQGVGALLFALAFVYFFWGVVQYVINPEENEKREKGKTHMIWGLIGLTVMFTVYGLLRVIIATFFGEGNTQQKLPPTSI